jgi:hypothetical protein
MILAAIVSITVLEGDNQTYCLLAITLILTSLNSLVGILIYKHWTYFLFELTIDLTNSAVFIIAYFEGTSNHITFNAVAIITTFLYCLIGLTLFWTEMLLLLWDYWRKQQGVIPESFNTEVKEEKEQEKWKEELRNGNENSNNQIEQNESDVRDRLDVMIERRRIWKTWKSIPDDQWFQPQVKLNQQTLIQYVREQEKLRT